MADILDPIIGLLISIVTIIVILIVVFLTLNRIITFVHNLFIRLTNPKIDPKSKKLWKNKNKEYFTLDEQEKIGKPIEWKKYEKQILNNMLFEEQEYKEYYKY